MNIKGIDFKVFLVALIVDVILTMYGILIPQCGNEYFQMFLNIKGNFLGVIVATFFINSFYANNSMHNRILIALGAGFGLIIYEFLQLLFKWQTFDIKDLTATCIGVFISLFINVLILHYQKKKAIE